MTTVECIMALCAWAEENICQGLKFKKPARAGAATDGGYEYELVTPSVFPFFIPASQRNPDVTKALYPCIVVSIKEASDSGDLRRFKVQMDFCIWNPGTHPADWLEPSEEYPGYYTEHEGEDFHLSMDGWHDLFNFIDVGLEKLESVHSIGDMRIVTESAISHGPAVEEGRILDTYPTFQGYIDFEAEARISRVITEIEDLL